MVGALKLNQRNRDEAIRLERIAREKLYRAQKMEAIGLLTGGAAHDLNNILSGIIGYPELILRKLPPDSPLRSSLQAIKQSGENAGAIITDLLTVTRGVAAPHQPCNLNTIVNEYFISPEWKNLSARYPQISCNKELDRELANIDGSALHLKKTLMNLVFNAMEATDSSGFISIKTRNQVVNNELAASLQVKPGDYAVLQIKDTGGGIPEESLGKIFEPFYTKKEMGLSGTGLGLTIVWNTVQDHDGGIVVESSSQGTTFELFFPTTKQMSVATDAPAVSSPVRGGGERILVVDDLHQQRDLAEQMLTVLDYVVETVASGEAAVSYLEKQPVDLIILDMIMNPGINGRETYERIIELNPHQKAIIASGYADSDEVKKTLALGASLFIQKPYNITTIAAAVHSVLTDNHDNGEPG